jgi:hypothetical protein
MRGVVLSLVLLIAGCGGNSYVQLASSGSPSTGVSTGGSVNIQGRSTVGVLIAIGILAGASYASDREHESYGMQRHRVPHAAAALQFPNSTPGAAERAGCSKPIENWSANLK